jgi:hypothetical protein
LQVRTHIGFSDVTDVGNPGMLARSPRLSDGGPSLKPSEIRAIASKDQAWTERGDLSAFVIVQQVLSECRNVVAYAIPRLREELNFYGETFPSVQRRFTLHRAIPAITIDSNSQQAPALN